MAQSSLAEFIEALKSKGLLCRYSEEKRVDELPQLMEANPERAVLVERVKDSIFPFFANGYATREMYALALECNPREVSREIARRGTLHYQCGCGRYRAPQRRSPKGRRRGSDDPATAQSPPQGWAGLYQRYSNHHAEPPHW